MRKEVENASSDAKLARTEHSVSELQYDFQAGIVLRNIDDNVHRVGV